MSDRTSVGKRAVNLTVSPTFNAYSQVVLKTGKDKDGNERVYTAGDTTGRSLELTNPWGSQQMAQDILDQLQTRNFMYQPYRATDAQMDPATELGDGITVNDVYSGVYTADTQFSSLMVSEVAAPEDEEIDHEYPYIPKRDREFNRVASDTFARISLTDSAITAEVARATGAEESLSSSISVTADAITAEVTRATTAEGELSSQITETAGEITAKVSKTSGDQTGKTGFGWTLTDSSWTVFSNKKDVLEATATGLIVYGEIRATSGYIGSSSSKGFTITDSAIYNGKPSLDDYTSNKGSGVYIGTDGISLGKSGNAVGFKVTKAGKLYAKDAELTGKIYAKKGGTIGGFNIGESNIYYGGYGKDGSVYISPNEIKLGSKFVVDSNGNLTCENAKIRGTLYAKDIKYGKQSDGTDYGYFSGSGLSGGSVSYSKLGSSAQTGVDGGNSYSAAAKNPEDDSMSYPKYFNCGNLKVFSSLYCNGSITCNIGRLASISRYVQTGSGLELMKLVVVDSY